MQTEFRASELCELSPFRSVCANWNERQKNGINSDLATFGLFAIVFCTWWRWIIGFWIGMFVSGTADDVTASAATISTTTNTTTTISPCVSSIDFLLLALLSLLQLLLTSYSYRSMRCRCYQMILQTIRILKINHIENGIVNLINDAKSKIVIVASNKRSIYPYLVFRWRLRCFLFFFDMW